AQWWASASFVIALALQYSLVVFAWVFPENGAVPRTRAAVLFAPGAVFVTATLAGLMWQDVRFVNGQFNLKLTPLAYAFGLYIYLVFAYGFCMLFDMYCNYRIVVLGQLLIMDLCAHS